MSVEWAVILCGGKGTRLRPLTDDRPKCLVEVTAGRCILDYQLDWLRNEGVKNVVLACGYKWEFIREKYGSRFKDLELYYSPDDVVGGNLAAVKKAMHAIGPTTKFYVLNGDNISDVALNELSAHEDDLPIVTFTQARNPYGVLYSDAGRSWVEEKPMMSEWINAGIYLFTTRHFNEFCNTNPKAASLERDYFQNIKPYLHAKKWLTIDSLRDLEDAKKCLTTD